MVLVFPERDPTMWTHINLYIKWTVGAAMELNVNGCVRVCVCACVGVWVFQKEVKVKG